MAAQSDEQEPKSNIAGLYNRVASLYGKVGPDAFSFAGRQLVTHMGIAEGDQVLDVGVGRGANLFPAAEKVGPYGRVVGIDLAELMVRETAAQVEQSDIENVTVLQMDAEQLAFDNDTFDAVLCGFAIFLFPNTEQALAEFFRVLRVGGKIGITIGHNPDALSQWYGKHLTEYHELYHFPLNAGGSSLNLRTELPSYLTRVGFTEVQVIQERTDFLYKSAEQWWNNKWTHGTRYSLEHMSAEVLAQFKAEVFAKLKEEQQSDGIREEWNTQYNLGTKS